MAKNLLTTNLVPNPSEMWRRQHKSTWIVVIKFLPFAYHHTHLGHHLGFHIFSQQPSWGLHAFYSWIRFTFLFDNSLVMSHHIWHLRNEQHFNKWTCTPTINYWSMKSCFNSVSSLHGVSNSQWYQKFLCNSSYEITWAQIFEKWMGILQKCFIHYTTLQIKNSVPILSPLPHTYSSWYNSFTASIFVDILQRCFLYTKKTKISPWYIHCSCFRWCFRWWKGISWDEAMLNRKAHKYIHCRVMLGWRYHAVNKKFSILKKFYENLLEDMGSLWGDF